jgi:acyl-ACP thioesterase
MLQQSFSSDAPIFSLAYFKHIFDSIETTAAIDGSNVVASFDEMKENGMYWIMADFRIQFLTATLFSNDYNITTFPIDANPLYALRAHNIYNATGQLMAQSITRWVTMDIATRGLGRIPAHLIERAYEKESDYLHYEKMRLNKDFEATRFFNYIIDENDVDQNAHTNNTVYMKLCIESASIMGFDLSTLDTFSVQFKKESYKDEILVMNAAVTNNDKRQLAVRINNGDQNSEISLSEITFK